MNPDRHKLQLIAAVWVTFLTIRLFLSNGIDLIQLLVQENILFTNVSFINSWTIPMFQYLGVISAVFVVLGIYRKYFFLGFLSAFLFLNYLVYGSTGSLGIWAFYFLPLTFIGLNYFYKEPTQTLRLLVLCWCLFYFFAGVAKIYPFWDGIRWLTASYTIENLLLSRQHESLLYLVFNIDIFRIPEHVIKVGIALSVLLELSAISILYKRQLAAIIVPAIIIFHAMLFLTGTSGIVEYSFAALIFLPAFAVEKVFWWKARLTARLGNIGAGKPPRERPVSVAADNNNERSVR